MTQIFLVIALLPGAIAWWSSRGLEKLKDDPALPELLFARRARIASATWMAVVATAFAEDPFYRFAFFVLSVASPFAGGYPLARKLVGYTISFPGYLWRGLKTLVASLGPLILLLYAPGIVTSVPEPWRLATLLLVPLMIAWSWWFTQVWLALNDARPLTNPDLNARIDDVASRAAVQPPALFVFGSERMKIVNAVALRGPRPAVALGNGLVELLSPDEVAAIYAHEIAHIEQVPERKLRKSRLVNWALMVVGVAGFYVAADRLPEGTVTILSMLWPLVIIGLLLRQNKTGKRHETESDLRAAELTGDPELVARALVKVHVHGLIPRRWSVDFEKGASHPSLARRIQALRGSSISAPAEAHPTIIQTARPSRVVAFDAARAYWFEGVPEGTQRELNTLREQASGMRAASWNDLVELRITADTVDDRALVATHKNGETWSVPIAKSDVAAVQKLLDSVDTRFHGGVGKAQKLSPRMLLSAAALLTFFGLSFLQLLPLVIAVFFPSTAMLAGIAGLTATNAVFRLTERIIPAPWGLLFPAASLVLAGVMLVSARQRARADRRDGLNFTVTMLGIGAAGLALAIAGSAKAGPAALARDPSLRGLAACLVGLGVALIVTGRRQARTGGAVSLAAGVAAIVLGVTSPFMSRGGAFTTEAATLHEARRVEFPARAISSLEVSPDGQGLLLEVNGPEDSRGRGEWQLRYGDSLWFIPAIGAGFVDSARLLSLWPSGDSLELRMERLDTTMVEWVMPLPPLQDARLTTRPGSRSWVVVGGAPDSDSMVVVSGAIGQEESPLIHLARIDSTVPGAVVPGPGGRSVIGFKMGLEGKGGSALLAALVFHRGLTYELWESSERGIRRLGEVDGVPDCGRSGSAAVRCMTLLGGQVSFWRFAGDSLEKEAVLVGGQFYRTEMAASGLITMLSFDGNEIQFGDPTQRSLLRATPPIGDATIRLATAAPGKLWVAVHVGSKVSVIEYRVERTSPPP